MLGVFETGVRYQMFHTVALLAAAGIMKVFPGPHWKSASWCFTAGIVLFSGSLYVIAVFQAHALGFITPLGGLCFLAGWIYLGIAAFKIKKEN